MREDGETDDETRVVRVANLTRIVNHKHLEEIFAHYGRVERVALERFRPDKADENGGDSSNLRAGFVEYERTGDAARAMSHMDGGQIDGKEVAVTRIRYVPRDAQRPGEHNFDRRDRDRGGGGPRAVEAAAATGTSPSRGRPRARQFGDHHDDRDEWDDRGPDVARGRRDSRSPEIIARRRSTPPPRRRRARRSRDAFDRRGPPAMHPGGYHRDGRPGRGNGGGFGRRRSQSPPRQYRGRRLAAAVWSSCPRGGGFRRRSRSRGGRRGGATRDRTRADRDRGRDRGAGVGAGAGAGAGVGAGAVVVGEVGGRGSRSPPPKGAKGRRGRSPSSSTSGSKRRRAAAGEARAVVQLAAKVRVGESKWFELRV